MSDCGPVRPQAGDALRILKEQEDVEEPDGIAGKRKPACCFGLEREIRINI